MIYKWIEPSKDIRHIIQAFWMVDSEANSDVSQQKIIPDGYPEMIFHLGDSYRINISGEWKEQPVELIAGQIRNHFFLENTGVSNMFAIKFQPWALTDFFGLQMCTITDQVIEIPKAIKMRLTFIKRIFQKDTTFKEKCQLVESWFRMQKLPLTSHYKAVEYIHEKKGVIQLHELTNVCNCSERTLERYFKSHIGVSPKFYSRIVRFSSIFKLVQEKPIDWQDIVYKAGYYDQSHFIKNFKEFTGEDPTHYGFSQDTMANFFLKK
jgi:methylphosphotriester-DNA--protein-cysteine methyltransferase